MAESYTFGSLVNEVIMRLEDASAVTSLGAAISDTTGTSVNLADYTTVAANTRIEVDSEVMLVTSADANPVTVKRGFAGTTAATHSNGAEVRRDPRFTRANIKNAINVVLADWCSYWFPRLVWDSSTGGSFSPTKWIVSAPTDAYTVERVCMQWPSGYSRFTDIPHTELRTYPTTIISTGLGFELLANGVSGYTIFVQYGKRWTFLELDADTLDSSFPLDADDLLVKGAVLYLTGWRAVPRFRLSEIAFHKELGAPVPTNFNLSELAGMHNEWVHRVTQVRNRRPQASPGKVWAGMGAQI